MTSSHGPLFPLTLATWRKRSGLTLHAIAAATKISVRYLEAIEEGKLDRLPGGVYSVSYIRQYARSIGYDADELRSEERRVGKECS